MRELALFHAHPYPWAYKPNAATCGNGSRIDAIRDARGETVATDYWSASGFSALWRLYCSLTVDQLIRLGAGLPELSPAGAAALVAVGAELKAAREGGADEFVRAVVDFYDGNAGAEELVGQGFLEPHPAGPSGITYRTTPFAYYFLCGGGAQRAVRRGRPEHTCGAAPAAE